jgi:uncharacterized protein YkwD
MFHSLARRGHALLLCVVVSSCAASCAVGDTGDDEQGRRDSQEVIGEGLDAEEQSFLLIINDYRASFGKAPLALSPGLTIAAKFHSTDMATKHYFSHTSLDGTDFAGRLRRSYDFSTAMGENIAAGHASGAATFEQWRKSPGHNANMLSDDFTAIGISRVYSSDVYHWYWTTDFGGYVDGVISSHTSAQFVRNFYQGALVREPSSSELELWTNALEGASGRDERLGVAQRLGATLFLSPEYGARNRTDDRDYVYDLYKGYLQREPDEGGWNFWTAQVPGNGRENVRLAFDLCTEFAEL